MLVNKLYNRISIEQAKESTKILESLELIKKDDNGFWKPTEKIITTGDNVKSDCIRRYQLTNTVVLKQILEEDKPGTHDSSQLTVSVSDIGIERIIKRIKQIHSEIMSIAHKDEKKADRVYQISIHAYPISRKD